MKTKITLAVTFLIATLSFAQDGINYKAVIKDNLGNVVANQQVTIEFTILRSLTLINEYQETHTPTTDGNGIVIVNIGEGSVVSGNYNSVGWGNSRHFLNIKINTGGGLVDMGTTEFMTVPFALHARRADGGVKKIDDLIDGKSDVDGSSLFIGVDAGLNDDGTDNKNIAIGFKTLNTNTTGHLNTANGYEALKSNTTGYANTAIGEHALTSNTEGFSNTATGSTALNSNSTGAWNTANGYQTLYFNTSGFSNTAIGNFALLDNTNGSNNTATGVEALNKNTTGTNNVANGVGALKYNTTGLNNTANGTSTLSSNTTGNENSAIGSSALYSNTVGIRNTANGFEALFSNTSGNYNTAFGYKALYNNTTGNWNTAFGREALNNLTSGTNNIGIGYLANVPSATGSNQVRIGNTSITYSGVQVAWSYGSDRRLKSNIKTSDLGLGFIKALKPVVYERNNDASKKTEYGFIAQEVEETLKKFGATNNGIITIDDDGKYSLRYNDLISVLTKAMQEQEEFIKDQNDKINEQAQLLNQVMARLDQLETKTTN